MRTLSDLSQRLYRLLLTLYPASHRREYGELMAQMFADMCRDALDNGGVLALFRLWLATVIDLGRSITQEHLTNGGITMMTTLPEKIDNYQILAQVGGGSAAVIYKAYDPQAQREVALKVLTDEGKKEFGSYFVNEAETWRTLSHPTIPEVYDYVRTDKHLYMVVELISGRDLLATLQNTETFLPEADVIRWGIAVCDFLTYLHTHEPEPLLFRDVKPANMMVDDAGQLHMVDFGIIARYKQDHVYDLIGTQGYASPEQYRGEIDPRTDIYSLGASLYHLATRIDPRPEQTPFDPKWKLPPFTFAPPRAVNPELSAQFASVIMKAVSYEPEDRFPTAEAMKAALEACL